MTFDDSSEQLVFEEYLARIVAMEQRRDRLDEAIKEKAASPMFADVVARLSAIRGISTITAFSIAAEIGDFGRFPNARSFMSYLGLVPSESSSGETTSRGKITRTGNIHVRTLLVESAWHHARSYSPAASTAYKDTIAINSLAATQAKEANRRLHQRYLHLKRRGKPSNVINAAVARELAGFVWSLAISGND